MSNFTTPAEGSVSSRLVVADAELFSAVSAVAAGVDMVLSQASLTTGGCWDNRDMRDLFGKPYPGRVQLVFALESLITPDVFAAWRECGDGRSLSGFVRGVLHSRVELIIAEVALLVADAGYVDFIMETYLDVDDAELREVVKLVSDHLEAVAV